MMTIVLLSNNEDINSIPATYRVFDYYTFAKLWTICTQII